jgi:ABC-type multidrug transport system ATPase subunit
MGGNEPFFHVRGLRAGYGERAVLHGVTFELPAGRVTGVMGPGSSGKTTLLRALGGGDDAPGFWRSGEIEPRSHHCAVLGQKPAGGERSLAEAVCLERRQRPPCWVGGRCREALAAAAVRRRLDELWNGSPAAAALEPVLFEPVAELPVPLRRLATVTVALGSETPCLLLDEPTAGIEGGEAEGWIATALRSLRGRRTVVLVTHNLRLAREVADFVLLLVDGEIIEAAETDRFFHRPRHPRTRSFVRMGS